MTCSNCGYPLPLRTTEKHAVCPGCGSIKNYPPQPKLSEFVEQRMTKLQYIMGLAVVAAKRSEDRHYQVGAVAVDENWRIVATGYNGLLPGQVEKPEFWNDKEKRKPFVIHAEQNLCSQFKHGEVKVVAVTLKPCPSCFQTLAAHGVEHVYYHCDHAASNDSDILAMFYDIELRHTPNGCI